MRHHALVVLSFLPLALAALAGAARSQTPPVLSLDVPPGQEVGPVMRVYGDDSSDLLGGGSSDAVAFGDVNGDGYADQIIGAALADSVGTVDFAGEVVVIYGGPSLPAMVDLDTDGVPGPVGQTRLLGEQAGDFLGAAVASGDIDGDGLDDIVMGALGGGAAGTGAGEVVIVYGHENLRGKTLNVGGAADLTTLGHPNLPGPSLTVSDVSDVTFIMGAEQQSSTGYSLATADVDGDGFDDVIIGAPGSFFFSMQPGGSVYVIYGGPDLRGVTIDLNTNGQTTAYGETRIFGDNAGEAMGHSVAAGDIDGDGYPDVVIGAPDADPFLSFDRGVVYVVYGGPGLRGASIDLDTNDAISFAGETRVLGVAGNARLGESVAVGDVNGDGLDDLVLGSPYVAPNGFPAGEVYIVPGNPGLRAIHVLLSAPPGTYNETRVTSDEDWSRFGESLAVGDVDGDGLDDVAVGATGAVPLGQLSSQVLEDGAVYLFQARKLPTSGVLIDPRAISDLIITADNPNDRIGTSVAAGGDMDFDGVPELAFGTVSGDHPDLIPAENRAGWTATVLGSVTMTLSIRRERVAGGDAAPMDFGPVLRVVVDHSTGPLSTDLAAVSRSSPDMPVANASFVAPVVWFLSTNRGQGQVDASLTFRYPNAEATGGDETSFAVYTSITGAGGTWVQAGSSQSRDTKRNAITVEGLPFFGFFCIAQDDLLDTIDPAGGRVVTSRPRK
jgi:hypothetical protein